MATERVTATDSRRRGAAVVDARAPRKRGRSGRLVAVVGLLYAVVGLLIAGAFLHQSDIVLPGVQAIGTGLGWRNSAGAAALLDRAWEARKIEVSAAGKSWSLTPNDLGIRIDSATTARQAQRQGRSLPSFQTMVKNGWRADVEPIWRLDPAAADVTLQTLAREMGVGPKSAAVRIVGTQVEATAASEGRALDVNGAMAILKSRGWEAVQSGVLELPTLKLYPAVNDVSGVLQEANQGLAELTAKPMSIRIYDPVVDEAMAWSVNPDELRSWLRPEIVQGQKTEVHWLVDQTQVTNFLQKQAPSLGNERYIEVRAALATIMESVREKKTDVRLPVYHPEMEHEVRDGETLTSIATDYGMPYPWIQQANPDLGDVLRVGQTLIIPSPDVLLPLMPVEGKRIIASISEQKMWAYESGKLKWQWTISTGLPESPTAPGIFQIQTHEESAFAAIWDLQMPWFMGIYRPVPTSDFMNGFHGFPSRDGKQVLWTNNLGKPITYGCLLVSTDNAKKLFEWAETGVTVVVKK